MPRMAENIRGDLPALQPCFRRRRQRRGRLRDAVLGEKPDAPPRERRPSPDDVIQLLYTSGTTGEPKGVMHTSNTMLSNLVPFAERLHLGADDVIHMPSPMAHQLGFMYGLVMPVMLGATAVLQDIFDPKEMARQIDGKRVTFTMGATPFLNDLAEYVERNKAVDREPARVRLGGRAHSARAGQQGAPGAGRRHHLGLGHVRERRGHHDAARGSGRKDHGNRRLRARRHGGARRRRRRADAVPFGQEGRLQVRGCSNFIGYLKRPELDNTDAEGWFDTGDLARMDAEGYIRIAGRSKDIIIRGGENIPVVEVEGLLFKHPAIAAVAVVGYPDARLGERACAFVVLREGASLSFAEMVAYLKAQQMAQQYIPERLEIVDRPAAHAERQDPEVQASRDRKGLLGERRVTAAQVLTIDFERDVRLPSAGRPAWPHDAGAARLR